MSHRGGRGGGPGGGDGGRGRGRGRVSADTDPSPRGGRGTRGRGGGSGGGGGSGRGNISTTAPPPAASGHVIGVPTAQPPASSGHVIGVPTAQPPSSSSPSVHEIGASSSSTATDLGKKMEQSLTLQQPAISSQISSGSALPPPVSSKSQNFPRRPGPGTVGKVCVVRANHFLVSVADKNIHQYDVLIKPEVTSRGVNRVIMSQLIELYSKSHLGNRQPVYDGRKSLFTAGPLPFISKEFVIDLDEKEDQSKSKRRERKFHVVIKLVSQPDLHLLRQFLSGRQNDAPYETIQALDVVLRESPTRMYTVVGRSFFSPNLGPTGRIGDGLECWTGYYQSIRATQMGLSLNIDVSATSFYEPLIVTEYVCSFLNIRDLSRPLSDTDRVKIKRALKGVKVQLTHRENIVRKRISGITSQPVSQLMFPIDDTGATESVLRYFNQKYGVVLKYPHLPCLQSGSDSKPVYLPMEVCRIVEGQRYSKKLSEKQVTGLLKAACKRPPDREASIREMVAYNNYKQDNFAAEFGISITDRLTTISNARVLPAPMLKYHDSGREVKVQPRVGQWNMINAKMVNGGKVETWACINFSNLKQDGAIRFFEELVGMCCSKGMVFSPNPIIPIRSVRPNQIESSLRALHKEAAANSKGKQLQLLIIILPDYSGSYGKIKRVCETELGIVSQCCQPKQAYKLNKQYLENVSLKINVKVGGRNTVLEDALLRKIPLVSDRPTIIFGADVTHPHPGEESPSIAAVVASMDWPEVTRYRCLVSAQPSRREMIDDLYKLENDPQRGTVHGGMIREHLIAFRKSTGFKPHRIIFYRDGVSEGQFSEVLLYEIDAIRKACASLEDGYLPPITFVVVQKRHHTRLFPNNHNDRNSTDRSGNILPGTVVDTMICHPTEFDFYLCSHAGIQGTSRPTHYHVLWDENKFSSDALQTLTNNLTYTYARCTRSVSIVPPAYYAHLGAFRARHYIEGDISDSGSSVGGSKSKGERSSVVRPLPKILDSVKDVMFYC